MPPAVAICDGGSPEIACGTSTSTPSVASSGSWTSNTWVTSQPPSAMKVTRKCGAAPAARATRPKRPGSASSAAVESPSRRTVRRVRSSFQMVVIVGLSVEEHAWAAQHRGEEPAPGALAGRPGYLTRAGPALARIAVEIAVEAEPHVDLRRPRREPCSVEAARDACDLTPDRRLLRVGTLRTGHAGEQHAPSVGQREVGLDDVVGGERRHLALDERDRGVDALRAGRDARSVDPAQDDLEAALLSREQRHGRGAR